MICTTLLCQASVFPFLQDLQICTILLSQTGVFLAESFDFYNSALLTKYFRLAVGSIFA